jgi:glutamyl-tRNA synthetase
MVVGTEAQVTATGRLAPSPTGVLHIGNARTLVLAWLQMRALSGRLLLRIEDLLPEAPEHLPGLLDDLHWLGLDWDHGPLPGDLWQPQTALDGLQRPVAGLCLQSSRHGLYNAVLAALTAAGQVYPCICTRKDIEQAARAPHLEDKGLAYPGTCRGRFASVADAQAADEQRQRALGKPPLGVALRLQVPNEPVHFVDALRGPVTVDLPTDSGDIVVRRKDGGHAYMLAVVVDDLAQGVTHVLRGDDLLEVTGQQLAVYGALQVLAGQVLAQPHPNDGLQPLWQRARSWQPPQHWHVPLVVGDDGRRLAKRNQSLHLRQLRSSGVQPAAVRRWIAQSCGLGPLDDLQAMAAALDLGRLPLHPVRFGELERQELAQ